MLNVSGRGTLRFVLNALLDTLSIQVHVLRMFSVLQQILVWLVLINMSLTPSIVFALLVRLVKLVGSVRLLIKVYARNALMGISYLMGFVNPAPKNAPSV